MVLFVLVAVYFASIVRLTKDGGVGPMIAAALLAALLPVLYATDTGMGRFSRALVVYLADEERSATMADIRQFRELGIINTTRVMPLDGLQVVSAFDSPNLVLIYLESFNVWLLDDERYPNLTPHLARLGREMTTLDHVSSSFVTIEGLVSSHCGILLPMTAGNDTFLESGRLLASMPCLGDILGEAGYEQYFLGGAAMEFAGKGTFFEQHGYEHVLGSEHWLANGFTQPEGVWGLSDTDLFENALAVARTAPAPWNLTLLTLGTHLPGYRYEGCEPYAADADPFIDAVHCTDQLVGRFVAALESEGLLDDTILLIVADHGVFPTPRMRELFGARVDDRRLVAITNYADPLPERPLSTYDLAPTVLSMLDVTHNASFVYGRSLLEPSADDPRHVTRYLDWDRGTMIHNLGAECGGDQTWPLTSCGKARLLSLTSQVLDYYSREDAPEALVCEVEVAYVLDGDTPPVLRLNDDNHFENFYHEGYRLASLSLDDGAFVFELSPDLMIVGHHFLPSGEDLPARYDAFRESSPNPLLTVLVEPGTAAEPGDVTLRLDPSDVDAAIEKSIGSGASASLDLCAAVGQ